jgi:anaerobic selenocysteine-containing dehydrogenase
MMALQAEAGLLQEPLYCMVSSRMPCFYCNVGCGLLAVGVALAVGAAGESGAATGGPTLHGEEQGKQARAVL